MPTKAIFCIYVYGPYVSICLGEVERPLICFLYLCLVCLGVVE